MKTTFRADFLQNPPNNIIETKMVILAFFKKVIKKLVL
jgi:hypothetical protein